ncbi:hypothetical protein Sru01_18480 [Sphaerisporangium rufum]|uniref:DUF397 domain-containing protein n=1 Tax=Sphaerisporangium rufum TaxID=1381558 RepID=A0A919QZB3_9ACTN|nr:DUF397 domain-containing protein [Sphaerisporangium rufum]GII76866.1 hypothetical protein Sru01_18480 [Sphaerisporangium rufum]
MAVTPDLSRAVWRKSRRSGGNGACVEMAAVGDVIAVRDSKNAEGPVMVLALSGWRAFVGGVRAGAFEAAG